MEGNAPNKRTCEESYPLADGQGEDVEGRLQVNMLNQLEEWCWIVGQVAWDTGVKKDMEPKH